MPATFARRSSGLVKEINLSDFGMWGLYMALVLFFNLFIFPIYMFELPGANVPLAIVIAFVVAIPIYVLYGALGSIMPRAGGDYLFQSRAIYPLLGLVITFGWATLNFNWPAFASTPFISLGGSALGPYFQILGTEVGNSGLISAGSFLASLNGVMITTVVFLALAFLLYLAGMKWLAKVQRYVLLPALFISAAAIPAIYLLSGSSTISHFDSISQSLYGTPDAYHAILNGATSNGYAPTAFSWSSTLVMSVLLTVSIGSSIFANPILGEVKGGGHFRNLTFTYMIAGAVTAFLFLFPELFLFIRTYGSNFVSAASYAAILGVNGTSVNVPLTYGYFTLAATNNEFLQTLFILGYIAVSFMLPILGVMMMARYVMGASIDGIMPLWFSSINMRLRRPINAMILPLILTIVAVYIEARSITGLLLLTSIGTLSTLAIEGGSGLAGILFPFRQRFLVKSSPIAKFPWIVVLAGVLVLGTSLTEAYWYFTIPNLALSLGTAGYGLMLGGVLIPIAIYVAMVSYRKRQGVDVMAAFREIPPE